MIVKNEASGIVKTLESVKKYVDEYCILDTESEDDTVKLIKETMKNKPGHIYNEPFVDFATTRNRVMELAGTSCVYTLMLSGDDVVYNPQELRRTLRKYEDSTEDKYSSFHVERRGPGTTRYNQCLIVRTGAGWRYLGVTHEVLVHPREVFDHGTIPHMYVKMECPPRDASFYKRKWGRDKELLERDVERDPTNARSWFYLAQTYDCLDETESAFEAYLKRINMIGYYEEEKIAHLRLGDLCVRMGKPWEEGMKHYLRMYEMDPYRPEPLYKIAQHYYDQGIHNLAYIFAHQVKQMPETPKDRLFVDLGVYEKTDEILAVSCYYTNPPHYREGLEVCKEIVQHKGPKEYLAKNMEFYRKALGVQK